MNHAQSIEYARRVVTGELSLDCPVHVSTVGNLQPQGEATPPTAQALARAEKTARRRKASALLFAKRIVNGEVEWAPPISLRNVGNLAA